MSTTSCSKRSLSSRFMVLKILPRYRFVDFNFPLRISLSAPVVICCDPSDWRRIQESICLTWNYSLFCDSLPNSRPIWRWCTRASPRTRSRVGRELILFGKHQNINEHSALTGCVNFRLRSFTVQENYTSRRNMCLLRDVEVFFFF